MVRKPDLHRPRRPGLSVGPSALHSQFGLALGGVCSPRHRRGTLCRAERHRGDEHPQRRGAGTRRGSGPGDVSHPFASSGVPDDRGALQGRQSRCSLLVGSEPVRVRGGFPRQARTRRRLCESAHGSGDRATFSDLVHGPAALSTGFTRGERRGGVRILHHGVPKRPSGPRRDCGVDANAASARAGHVDRPHDDDHRRGHRPAARPPRRLRPLLRLRSNRSGA